MKKLSNCNNIVITTLIIIGTFIVFFYLYVYGYKNEGFINFDGNQTVWDKKNYLENKLNDIKYNKLPPLEELQPRTYKSCDALTSRGASSCNSGITSTNQRCFWNNKVKNSQGGICDGVF